MSVNLPLLCFNDVYRVHQRYVPQPGSPAVPDAKSDDEIRVGQFGQLIYDIREKWKTDPEGTKDGLLLFAGDVFSPSVESSVTRGSHMVPILNALGLDCACVGNHDFDFGYPHMTRLVGDTSFPWLLSNVYDVNTGTSPAPLKPFVVMERCGVRIGLVGLVEEDWIATIPSWPDNFRYRPMKEVGLELSKKLRDPNGEYNVDIIIALTHSRVPNDIRLAKELGAVADMKGVENQHGVDLIIGGHDHIYYIGKGASSWEGFAGSRDKPGVKDDDGVRLIKSGTDFRDLSEATLHLSPPNSNAIRRRTVTELTGIHHYVLPTSPSSPQLDKLVQNLLASVTKTLSEPVCYTLTPFDARSEVVRTQESALGNWAADVVLHAYDDSIIEKNTRVQFEKENATKIPEDGTGADAVIICGGTLRGDSQYGPGIISLGDILEIFPFDDPVVCLEIDGKGIWDTLESALSRWPAQEGRFPIVSGLAVDWDHRKPAGSRINSIHLTVPSKEHHDDDDELSDAAIKFVEGADGTRIEVKEATLKLGEEVKNVEGGRTYYIITRDYMAQGFDGFGALKGRKMLVDHEVGQSMSAIIRSFLLGSAYIFRHKQLKDAHQQFLCDKTVKVLSRARAQHRSPVSSLGSSPQRATHGFPNDTKGGRSPTSPTLVEDVEASFTSSMSFESSWTNIRRHVIEHDWVSIREALHIAKHEHMSSVDSCDGGNIRRQTMNDTTPRATPPSMLVDAKRKEELKALGADVAVVSPQIDGRMRDVAAACAE